MVKVKLSCFLPTVVVILAIVQSSFQASIQGSPSQSSHKEKARSSGSSKSDESFVFPDDNITRKPPKHVEDRVFMPMAGVQPPSCANGSTFCEYVDEYPADHVAAILKKQGHALKGFFNMDVIDTALQDRITPIDENPLCATKEQIIYPKLAENKNGDWLYVVNEENYKQGVRIEKCLSETQCSFADIFPSGYTTHCKQHYIYRNLVGLSKTGETVTDPFKLPSCCTCVVKLDESRTLDRMAQGSRPLPLTIPKTTPTTVTSSKHRYRN